MRAARAPLPDRLAGLHPLRRHGRPATRPRNQVAAVLPRALPLPDGRVTALQAGPHHGAAAPCGAGGRGGLFFRADARAGGSVNGDGWRRGRAAAQQAAQHGPAHCRSHGAAHLQAGSHGKSCCPCLHAAWQVDHHSLLMVLWLLGWPFTAVSEARVRPLGGASPGGGSLVCGWSTRTYPARLFKPHARLATPAIPRLYPQPPGLGPGRLAGHMGGGSGGSAGAVARRRGAHASRWQPG